MKHFLQILILGIATCSNIASAQPTFNPAKISVYITPYYNSKGPSISVGEFSKGLASNNEKQFIATIAKMRESWEKLSFPELYVAAIRLYDLGYRKESIYWYYTAQYRGRLFGLLLDQKKMGGLGAPGFELLQAQGSFFQLTGPYITGYAFTDFDHLMEVIARVRTEGQKIPDLKATYRGVEFKADAEWATQNEELNAGMGKLLETFKQQRESIRERRMAEGIEAKFSKLKNKELPSR